MTDSVFNRLNHHDNLINGDQLRRRVYRYGHHTMVPCLVPRLEDVTFYFEKI